MTPRAAAVTEVYPGMQGCTLYIRLLVHPTCMGGMAGYPPPYHTQEGCMPTSIPLPSQGKLYAPHGPSTGGLYAPHGPSTGGMYAPQYHLPTWEGGVYAQRLLTHHGRRGGVCAEATNPPWEKGGGYAQRLLTHHGEEEAMRRGY